MMVIIAVYVVNGSLRRLMSQRTYLMATFGTHGRCVMNAHDKSVYYTLDSYVEVVVLREENINAI